MFNDLDFGWLPVALVFAAIGLLGTLIGAFWLIWFLITHVRFVW